jgi:hypothetical protein
MIHITRRQALTGIAGMGAQIGLSACSLPITPFCPTDPTISDPSAPLTIDVHTHVFNGSDLQVQGFFNWVVLNNGSSELGAILQELGRDFAPTAAEEMEALQQIESAARVCDSTTSFTITQNLAQQRYSQGKNALQDALKKVRATRGFQRSPPSSRIERAIGDLPDSYADYKNLRRRRPGLLSAGKVTDGDIDFILRNFQYRYVNVHD